MICPACKRALSPMQTKNNACGTYRRLICKTCLVTYATQEVFWADWKRLRKLYRDAINLAKFITKEKMI